MAQGSKAIKALLSRVKPRDDSTSSFRHASWPPTSHYVVQLTDPLFSISFLNSDLSVRDRFGLIRRAIRSGSALTCSTVVHPLALATWRASGNNSGIDSARRFPS